MYTPFHELKSGREYYITSNGKKCKGIFAGYSYMTYNYAYAWFQIQTLDHYTIKTFLYYYTDKDEFYDVKYIRMNAKNAIQQMELRTLNMILKRLVNEEFQWS